jgi:hypothetical protein
LGNPEATGEENNDMKRRLASILVLLTTVGLLAAPAPVAAVVNPQSGSLGLEATVPGAPPTQAATIGVPSNGQTFTATPITVSGLCKDGLLIKVFSNNVFVGSVTCVGGSYSLKVDLFSGRNDLVARVYDALDQQGPDSNVVSVFFNDAQFAQFGTHVALSSTYARIGADPGAELSLPLVISGGQAPYALSIDWGDGNGSDLKTVSFAGIQNVTHRYTQSGVYTIVAKATDSNDTSAYLQIVGVANGKIAGGLNSSSQSTTVRNVVLWQPLLAVIPMMLLAFWLGQRHELTAIRRSIEQSRDLA